MISDIINIKAKLTLHTKENGGRESGIETGYRPNHVMEYLPNSNDFPTTYIGQRDFDKDRIYPGETENVKIMFLRHQNIKELLKKGRVWWFNEGARKIGEAGVLEILAE
jgi:translation elongation factor EF-Tu-like GTPase